MTTYSQTFVVKLAANQTGLASTLLAKIYSAAGVLRVTTTAGVGWTEFGNGEYEFTYASFDDTSDKIIRFYDGANYETSTTVAPDASVSGGSVDITSIDGDTTAATNLKNSLQGDASNVATKGSDLDNLKTVKDTITEKISTKAIMSIDQLKNVIGA